jgi:deazaflavin-dependent oxidoreductase (nitroreductase family)
MASEEKIYDSPVGNVKRHIQQYIESKGKKGHLYRGLPSLLITTRGRKTSLLRRSALIYGRDGESYVVVASNAGSPRLPFWYLNLVANPEVELMVGPEVFKAQARTATPEEKQRLWPVMTGIYPTYLLYQHRAAGREIPLVILERTG